MIIFIFFFFNDTATTEIYTLSLHDALPISLRSRTAARSCASWSRPNSRWERSSADCGCRSRPRSEEHTSELQSQSNLVCRLLLEKKKKTNQPPLRLDVQHADMYRQLQRRTY